METQPMVKKVLEVNAPVATIWDALTNPVIIKEYLYGTQAISEWKEGSPLLFTGTWEGKEYTDKGTILKFDPLKVFQYNYWSAFSGLPDLPGNYSVITFVLEDHGNKTILTAMQDNIPTIEGQEHANSGWGDVLKKMKQVIEEKS